MPRNEAKGIITVLEDGRTVSAFTAPAESYAARKLCVFLVENLRPGLEVVLSHETCGCSATPAGK